MLRFTMLLLPALLLSACERRAGPQVGNVQHVVFFKFKGESPPAEVQKVMAEFRKLPSKIPGIVGFQDGKDMSRESLEKGFTHAIIVTFRDQAARDAYLSHPEHEAFKKIALPVIADVCVLDFVVGDN